MPPKTKSKGDPDRGTVYELLPFSMDLMAPGNIISVVAKRGSGKSVLIKQLLYRYREAPVCMAFSATEEYNQFYGDIIDERLIHADFDTQKLTNLIERQKVLKCRNKKNAERCRPLEDPHIVVVFDDMMANATTIFNDTNMKFLFFNGRHLHISVIIAAQYIINIPPQCRANIDIIFLFMETNITTQKKLFDFFGASVFPTFLDFKATMDHYTQNYGCMVIVNNKASSDYRDRVFCFKAEINLPKFRFLME